MPDTTIKVLLNVSAESVQVGDRAWLDCVVVGDPTARIEFSKDDADELPENAQVEMIFWLGFKLLIQDSQILVEMIQFLTVSFHHPPRYSIIID